jgi:hypothetical protein
LKSDVLRFVRKHERPIWKDEVCIGSTVQWSFLTTARDGSEIKREANVEQRIVRGVVSVIFPDRWIPNGETFIVGLERKSLTIHEVAFGPVKSVIEVFGLSNRRCSIWAQWPQAAPDCVVTLDRRLPNDSRSSVTSLRTERLATMEVRLDPPSNAPFIFVPSANNPHSTNAP